MKRNELIETISNKTGLLDSICDDILDIIISEIRDALVAGEKVSIKNFMTFEVRERSERDGRNPATGEVVLFPPVKTIKCNVCQAIKDAVNGK